MPRIGLAMPPVLVVVVAAAAVVVVVAVAAAVVVVVVEVLEVDWVMRASSESLPPCAPLPAGEQEKQEG